MANRTKKHHTYRHKSYIHRSATYVSDEHRIKKIRDVWEKCMKECKLFGCSAAYQLNPQFGRSTIRRRYSLWRKEEAEGIPLSQRKSTYYDYSTNHWNRKFSVEEERKLAQHLKSIIESKVEIITKSTVKEISIDMHNEFNKNAPRTRSSGVIPFSASSGFITRFKARNEFTRRKPKMVKLPVKWKGDKAQQKQINEFRIKVEKAIKKCGIDYILNMDETPAKVVEQLPSGWGIKGEEKLEVRTDGNTREQISIIPTITAGGDRLKFAWIHHCKTDEPVVKMFNIPKNVLSYFSESGWINEGIMLRYLREIVAPYVGKHKSTLLIDDYPAHWTPAVRALAKKLHVDLLLVPKGTTSTTQPLDVNFNGPMKKLRQKYWLEERSGGKLCTDNVERTAIRAVKAYEAVSAQTISKAWAKAIPSISDVVMHRHRPRRDG